MMALRSVFASLGALAMAICLVATINGCDSTEQVFPVADCRTGMLPANTQCLFINGGDFPFRYDEEELHGSWNHPDLESCTVYRPDGTGTVHHWGLVEGLDQREPTEILWGIGINDDGTDVVEESGERFVFHQSTEGSLLDARMLLLNYTPGSGLSQGYESVEACPDTTTGQQGAFTFYSSNDQASTISAVVDGFTVGVIVSSLDPEAEPECGSEVPGEVVTVYRQPGQYSVGGASAALVWGPVLESIEPGQCTTIPFE